MMAFIMDFIDDEFKTSNPTYQTIHEAKATP
jgi:hypothetical protein